LKSRRAQRKWLCPFGGGEIKSEARLQLTSTRNPESDWKNELLTAFFCPSTLRAYSLPRLARKTSSGFGAGGRGCLLKLEKAPSFSVSRPSVAAFIIFHY
jgi:hypothetical protein